MHFEWTLLLQQQRRNDAMQCVGKPIGDSRNFYENKDMY